MNVQSAVGAVLAAQRPAVHVVPEGHFAVHVVGGTHRKPPVTAPHSMPIVSHSSRAMTPLWQLTRVWPSQRPAAVSVPQPSAAPTTKQSAKAPIVWHMSTPQSKVYRSPASQND